jgi:tRNA (guanosine-2'-O-)-methyltransferase
MNLDRYHRIQTVLKARQPGQPDLTLCLEEVHKPNNVSAIIRSADAAGVHKVHAVWPDPKMRTLSRTSAGARNWVEVDTHESIDDSVGVLKGQGMQILATNLSDTAVDFREIDYTKPTAVILGGEKARHHQTRFINGKPRHHNPYGRYGAVSERVGRQCADLV